MSELQSQICYFYVPGTNVYSKQVYVNNDKSTDIQSEICKLSLVNSNFVHMFDGRNSNISHNVWIFT